MGQRPVMLEHLPRIAHIEIAVAGWAEREVISFIRCLTIDTLAEESAAWNVSHG